MFDVGKPFKELSIKAKQQLPFIAEIKIDYGIMVNTSSRLKFYQKTFWFSVQFSP
jgi:hypothetical protein